ncbi:hypothetical protein ACSV5G_00100 [Agrobacterium cavarae]|uniref:hypothetical protein n=1 Tax=Agrobacterium cavarae TaxID=2528239 RepID=UPI003FD16176
MISLAIKNFASTTCADPQLTRHTDHEVAHEILIPARRIRAMPEVTLTTTSTAGLVKPHDAAPGSFTCGIDFLAVSQVNEMLTWMESHLTPFDVATDLSKPLCLAAWRRLLVKVSFEAMTTAQALTAFRRTFGVDAPPELAPAISIDTR